MSTFGLRDLPLENIEDEALGLGEYASALSQFICNCETPLTIALQGDWGSGKTSLMNLIKMQLEKDNANIEKAVWFNTWQYSQFGMENELSLSLISTFLDALKVEEETKQILNGLRNCLKRAKDLAPALAGAAAGSLAEKMTENFLQAEAMDPAQQLTKLKAQIEKTVEKIIGNNHDKRIVVFVDDLDRLLPERAVELLEVFKLFLDVKGCVFILACDYQVVSQGLKKKFGVGSDELKGKSFFDKIIQLPFSMPLGHYDVGNYIASLLTRIGMEYKEDELALYVDLVNYSIGFNPRSIKRIFNSLLLLNIVASKKKLLDDQSKIAQKYEKQKILFATICMQTAYESIYKYLLENSSKIENEFIQNLKDENTYRDDSKLQQAAEESIGKNDKKLMKLTSFMSAFIDAIQLESDADVEMLSTEEIEILKSVLTFSAITSVESSDAEATFDYDKRWLNRDLAQKIVKEQNSNYVTEFEELGYKLNTYQPRKSSDICINLNLWNIFDYKLYLEFWLGDWDDKGEKICMCITTNKKSEDDVKKWVDSNFRELFPDIKYYPYEGDFLFFWEEQFNSNDPEEHKHSLFKNKVNESLQKILPLLAKR